MATATTQGFTFHLPPDFIELLQQVAAGRHETPDHIVAEALRVTLHSMREEALRRRNRQIRQQQTQSAREIRARLEA